MKKQLSLVLVLSVLSVVGYTQNTNLDAEVEAELNKMYQSSQKPSPPANTMTIPSEPSAQAPKVQPAVTAQPIYIVNPPQVASAAVVAPAVSVQKEPTTLIEASPLTDSRAESLRKARQDAELSTEAKIVEKLEQSRLEDEKRRAQILFGDKLSNGAATAEPTAQPAAPAQPVPPQIIILPAPVAAPVAEAPKKEEAPADAAALTDKKVEAEMDAALKLETSVAAVPVPVTPVMQKYFTGAIGVSDVGSDVVKGNYALGFTFGTKYDSTYSVEGTFTFSNSEVENIRNEIYWSPINLFDMNQYSGAVALKYYMFDGMVKPVLGGLAQYSYREFKWSDKNGFSPSLGRSSSHAFDVGALAGIEIEFSPKMRMGFDVRYYKNIAVNRDYSTDRLRYNYGAMTQQQINDVNYGYRTPVEELDAYSYGLSMTVNF
jgi:hypothetical protein